MHYYSHNIGDYRKDTHHLSLLEHGVYRQLLDTYYLSEKPLNLDHAVLMRTHCARNADDVQAIENVLRDFFVRTEDGYIHKRCDVEIEAFHSKSVSARESAKARWDRVRAEKEAKAMRTHSEGNANQEPLTINQEPEDQEPCPQQAENGHKFRFADIQEAYNRICSPKLPACRAASDKRKKQAARLMDLEFNGIKPFRVHGQEFLELFFNDCLTNKHWIGENNTGWRADFDFVTKTDNAIKLLERMCD
jgi:uncharacterized protein YdaU (DUF1376 family)